jgi:hypothetical protein
VALPRKTGRALHVELGQFRLELPDEVGDGSLEVSECEIQTKIEGARVLRTVEDRCRLLTIRHGEGGRTPPVGMLERDELSERIRTN